MKIPPCLDAVDVEASASAFRDQYARSHIGPLEIEKILEFEMEVEIVPVRQLCKRHRCKGYVCAGGSRICVDRDILRNQPEEYRTVLTHETAHIYYHPGLIPPAYASLEECRNFLRQLSQEVRYSMEWEAREWSGRVLIPGSPLRAIFDDLVDSHHKELLDVFGPDKGHTIMGSVIADVVADRFGVLQPIAEARIRREGLWSELGRRTKRLARRQTGVQVS